MSVDHALAVAICDRWQEICERPQRWPTTPEIERATFRDMAAHALAAGRRGERSEEQIAQALCLAFWRGAPKPRAWAAHGGLQKQAFRLCAQRVLEVAAAMRAKRQPIAA